MRACGSDPGPLRPAIAALLGRFLPGLGPLAAAQAAFLFGCAQEGTFRALRDEKVLKRQWEISLRRRLQPGLLHEGHTHQVDRVGDRTAAGG